LDNYFQNNSKGIGWAPRFSQWNPVEFSHHAFILIQTAAIGNRGVALTRALDIAIIQAMQAAKISGQYL
jgi:hypothetical protein